MTTIIYFLTFIFELCLNEDLTHKHDWYSRKMHSPKIKYTTAELLNLILNVYIAKIDTGISNQIKNLKIKHNFRRKRGRTKVCSRIWKNNNAIHDHLLWPLVRSDKTFRNSIGLNMALVSIYNLLNLN